MHDSEPEIAVSPKTDLAYLLLAFVACFGLLKLSEHLSHETTEPSEPVASVAPQHELHLTLDGEGPDGLRVLVEGSTGTAPTVVTPEELERLLRDRFPVDGTFAVVLQADKGAPYSHVRQLLDIAQDAGAVAVTIATRPKMAQ